MRILIVGGTSFVGRAVAWSALNAGHDVTVINRGQTPSDLPESVTRLVGDRHGDMSALADVSFDVTVDAIAFRPADVDVLATALEDRGGHHIQISSVSAYEDPPSEGATEESATLWNDESLARDAEVTGETYGPLKAACERAAEEHFGEQLTIVRPTFVIGSHDATLRFPYWVERLRIGGNVAVPGPRRQRPPVHRRARPRRVRRHARHHHHAGRLPRRRPVSRGPVRRDNRVHQRTDLAE